MNPRFEIMKTLLMQSRYFKLVCGAGNENAEEVRKLAFVYTLAGANGFDVSATPAIVRACISGIDEAFAMSHDFKIILTDRPFVTISVGMPGDHHVRKAHIAGNCVDCGKCIPVCPTDAIFDNATVTDGHATLIVRDKCIGCGNCEAICPPKVAAIRYEHNGKALRDILPPCLDAGAENIELHAAVPDNEAILEEWAAVSESQPDNFISMCVDRHHLSNVHLIERIRQAKVIAGERLIIQADGVPMSGGKDDFNTTLQAIAIADVIHKNLIDIDRKFKNLPILLSGGTNTYTGEMAKMCGVPFAGVSIGTHARKIVKQFIESSGFGDDHKAIGSAVAIARELIVRNLQVK